jgi:hypothetical protein
VSIDARDPLADPLLSSPLLRPLSRRRLLQGAGALAAAMVLGDACGSNTSPSPQASALGRTLTSPVPLTSPSAAPLVLTEDALRAAQAPLTRLLLADTLALPGGTRAKASDLEAAGTAMDASTGSPSFFPNPVAALGLVLAAADWSGGQGALDLSVTLPTLPLRVVRLVLPDLHRRCGVGILRRLDDHHADHRSQHLPRQLRHRRLRVRHLRQPLWRLRLQLRLDTVAAARGPQRR